MLSTPWSRRMGLRVPILNAPMGGVAGLLQVEGVDKPAVRVPIQPLRMIERLVEDPYRLDVLERRQVLAAEDQDLVGPEGLPQRLRRGGGQRGLCRDEFEWVFRMGGYLL